MCCYYQVFFIRLLFIFFFMLLLLLCKTYAHHQTENPCNPPSSVFFWHRKNHQATQSLREPRMYATKPRRRAALSARQQLFHQSCGYTLATSFWFHLSRGGFLDPYKGYLYPREWLVEGISTYMKTHKNSQPFM